MPVNLNDEIESYIKKIDFLAGLPDSEEKVSLFSKILSDYYCFCYKNNLMVSFSDIMKLEKSSYILPSTPDIFCVNLQDAQNASMNLQHALQNGGGILENDAKALLNWTVQKAREVLNKACGDITNSSLTGYCGLGQALTLIPFKHLGANITINNASKYPYSNVHHGFGTVTLPISTAGQIIDKTYLLDVTYRQFFTTLTCHNGRFFSANPAKKDLVGPNVGYYIKKYPGGIELAKDLLKNGFIELDEEKAKIYGVCFSAQSLNKNNINNLKDIFEIDAKIFSKQLTENQVEFTFNDLELAEIAEQVKVPRTEQIYR